MQKVVNYFDPKPSNEEERVQYQVDVTDWFALW